MATAVSPLADHRRRALRALGVTPYGLRASFRSEPVRSADDDAREVVQAPIATHTCACVLVMPGDCGERERQLVERIMRVIGGVFADAARVDVTAGEVTMVPAARAYLAFGKAQAHALGRALPTDVMAAAEVLLLDAPDVLFTAAAKRRLWQAISGLRRLWRDAPERGG